MCSLCKIEDEDQQHILTCKVLTQNIKSNEVTKEKIKYEDIFSSDIQKQKVITVLYQELFRIREHLNSQLAPSTTQPVELRTSDDLLQWIDNLFSRKKKMMIWIVPCTHGTAPINI